MLTRFAFLEGKTKRFQEARFSARPATGMHGTEPCVSERRALPSPLPEQRFFRHPDQHIPDAPAFRSSLKRDRLLVTAFRSPATAPDFADTVPGSTFLVCYFAARLIAYKPVRLSASRLVRFAPLRPFHRFSPLPAGSQTLTSYLGRLHSPSGLLPPSGSTRSAVRGPIGPPSGSTRSPFAPRFRCSSVGSGSLFQDSLLPRRLAVPQNLLEPLPLCASAGRASTRFCNLFDTFP